MTQRDRLAAAIHAAECYVDVHLERRPCHAPVRADALIARGVRVVDAETLGAAMEKATKQPSGEIADFYVRFAADVLAALDGAE